MAAGNAWVVQVAVRGRWRGPKWRAPVEALQQDPADLLVVDPRGQLLDLVVFEVAVPGQPGGGDAFVRRVLAVAGVHVPGDAEQPRPGAAPGRVERVQGADRLDERLGCEVGDRLGLAPPAGEEIRSRPTLAR
jgi:hypothetical protein